MAIEVMTKQEGDNLLSMIQELRREQAIQALVLNTYGWIPLAQVHAMNIHGLTSYKGTNAAKERGELTMKGEGKIYVSAKSLIGYLRKKGFSLESIQERLAA